MDEASKIYWKIRDRLADLDYYAIVNEITSLMKKRDDILNKVILEFAKEHAP